MKNVFKVSRAGRSGQWVLLEGIATELKGEPVVAFTAKDTVYASYLQITNDVKSWFDSKEQAVGAVRSAMLGDHQVALNELDRLLV